VQPTVLLLVAERGALHQVELALLSAADDLVGA
jgi:hypothetical protein